MAQRRTGRPSKLTPERKKRLLDAIRAGSYYEPACTYAGVDYSTFRRWMQKGEEAKSGQYREFYEAVIEAEAQAEVRVVGHWQNQIPHDWRAAKDFLSRRYPERWASRETLELNGGVQIGLFDEDPRDELLRRMDRIAARSDEAASDSESAAENG